MYLTKLIFKFTVFGLIAILLSACVAGGLSSHKVHHTIIKEGKAKLPKKVILLPMIISVKRLTAGGVLEDVKEWENSSKANVRKAIIDLLAKEKQFQLTSMPSLNAKQANIVDEHVALYNRVGFSALRIPAVPEWRNRHNHFDYTLGDGLNFLRKISNADAAMVVFGQDVVSSGGRVAASILIAALGGSISKGYAYVSIGIIDLRTGAILWTNRGGDGSNSFRKPEQAMVLVNRVLKLYPGIEKYKKTVKKK